MVSKVENVVVFDMKYEDSMSPDVEISMPEFAIIVSSRSRDNGQVGLAKVTNIKARMVADLVIYEHSIPEWMQLVPSCTFTVSERNAKGFITKLALEHIVLEAGTWGINYPSLGNYRWQRMEY
jgi:hypothetical protein